MPIAELKSEIERLPLAEKSYLAAFLKHSTRRQDPCYLASLNATWNRMQAGEKVSLCDAMALSDKLGRNGA